MTDTADVDTDPSGWADSHTSDVDMDLCITCERPTNSHLLLFRYDPDRDVFKPAATPDDADAYGQVCHGCYADEDGDAAPILQAYRLKVKRICDQYGLTVSQLVEDPDHAQEIMDPNDWKRL